MMPRLLLRTRPPRQEEEEEEEEEARRRRESRRQRPQPDGDDDDFFWFIVFKKNFFLFRINTNTHAIRRKKTNSNAPLERSIITIKEDKKQENGTELHTRSGGRGAKDRKTEREREKGRKRRGKSALALSQDQPPLSFSLTHTTPPTAFHTQTHPFAWAQMLRR